MFSKLIVRYASRKRFSIPSTNFKYAERKVENAGENYLPPMYPIEEDQKKRSEMKNRPKFKDMETNYDGRSIKRPSSKSQSFNSSTNEKITVDSKVKEKRKLEGKYKSFSTSGKIKASFEPAGELIFGIHPVFHALQAQRRKFYHLYYKAGLEEKNDKIQEILKLADGYMQVEAVPLSQLTRIIGEDRVHQGICCDVSPLHFEKLDTDFLVKDERTVVDKDDRQCSYQLWLYMDRIQDPMNFGAILRTAYFMGVNKVITSKENSCRLSGIVSKASAGVAEMLPVYQVENLKGLLQELVCQEWNLVSAAPDNTSSVPLSLYMPKGNTIIAVGNEGYGITPELQSLFKTTITVQPGRTLRSGMDSLNVSVATAVILHDITSKLSSIRMRSNETR